MTTHILVKNSNLICHNNKSQQKSTSHRANQSLKKKTLLTQLIEIHMFVRKSAKLLVPLASFEKKNKAEEKANFKNVFSSMGNSCDAVSTMYLVSMTTHLGQFCIFATIVFCIKMYKTPNQSLLIYYCEFQQTIEQGPQNNVPHKSKHFSSTLPLFVNFKKLLPLRLLIKSISVILLFTFGLCRSVFNMTIAKAKIRIASTAPFSVEGLQLTQCSAKSCKQ